MGEHAAGVKPHTGGVQAGGACETPHWRTEGEHAAGMKSHTRGLQTGRHAKATIMTDLSCHTRNRSCLMLLPRQSKDTYNGKYNEKYAVTNEKIELEK